MLFVCITLVSVLNRDLEKLDIEKDSSGTEFQGTTGWEPVAPTQPSGEANGPFQTAQAKEKIPCHWSLGQ